MAGRKFKIVLFGGPRVGKTAIVERWLYNRFNTSLEGPPPTHRVAISTKMVEIDNKIISVEIWDTPSIPEIRDNLFDEYMKDADIVGLVADVDRLSSFPEVCTTVFDQIKEYCELHYDNVLPVVAVLANKRDMSTAFGSTAATVTEESIAATAQGFGIHQSFLVSAAVNAKLDDAFDTLLRQAILQYPPRVWHPPSAEALQALEARRQQERLAKEEEERKRQEEAARVAADLAAAELEYQSEQERLESSSVVADEDYEEGYAADDGDNVRNISRASTARGAAIVEDEGFVEEGNIIVRGGGNLPMLQV